jgi:hypothetical protein
MMTTPPLRRSRRFRTLPKRLHDPAPQLPPIEKRSSARLRKVTQSKVVKTIVQTKRTIHYLIDDPKPRERISQFVEDSASEEADTEDDEDEENTESDELLNLTADGIEYNAADPLDRRDSHDSRLDSGNEEYEVDDFVVNDDSDDSASEIGSEITLYGSDDDVSDIDGRFTATPSLVDEQYVLSTVDPGSNTRKDSAASTRSSDSGLFVRDPDDLPQSLSPCLVDLSLPTSQVLGNNAEPSDIAEEISDAVCRFSRRCNRHCAPLRLELSSECFTNAEVNDAIERAIKQGLGSCTNVGDGRVLCIVGAVDN